MIAAILERNAPSVADVAPASLDRVLKRCPAKDPDLRRQTAADLKAELKWIASDGGATGPQWARRSVLPWAVSIGAWWLGW